MLIFRSEDHVEHWCTEQEIARGAVISLEQCWEFSKIWYADRLHTEWRPKTIDEMEEIFKTVGFESEFWNVRG
ncbi:MAG: hypothetical protein IIA89_14910 [Chloroflexi bacterium]|nr:hypothetical protein [Chloroflexota bacterium]